MPRFVNASGSVPSSRRSGGISLQQHHHRRDREFHSQGGLSFPDEEASMSMSSSPIPPAPPPGPIRDGGGRDDPADHRDDDDDDATALNDGSSSGDDDDENDENDGDGHDGGEEDDRDDGRSVELLPPPAADEPAASHTTAATTTANATPDASTKRAAGDNEGEEEGEDGARAREGVRVNVPSPASRTLDALDSMNASQDAVDLFCRDIDTDTDGDGVGGGGDGGGDRGGGGGDRGGAKKTGGIGGLRGWDGRDGGGGGGGGDGGRSSSSSPSSASSSGRGRPSDRSDVDDRRRCSDRGSSSGGMREERCDDGVSESAKYRHNAVDRTGSSKRVTDDGGGGLRTAPTTREECRNDDDRSHGEEEEEGGGRNRDVIFAKQRAKMEARSRARSQQRSGQGQKRGGCRDDDPTGTTAAATSSKKSDAAKTSEVGGAGKRGNDATGAVAAGTASTSSASHRNDDDDDDDSGIKFRVTCNACRREARRRRTTAPPTLSESSDSSSDEEEDREPHHSLCRHSPHFDQYLLDLCRAGVRMGCRSCANHARFDESRGASHLKSCRRNRSYEKNATKEWQSRQQRLQTRKDEIEASMSAAPVKASKKKPKKKTVVSSKSTAARSTVSIGKKNKQSQKKKPENQRQKPKQNSAKKGDETRRQKAAGSGKTECLACQRERLAGKKLNLFHKASCPRGATDARKKPINSSMSSKSSLGQARSGSDTRLLASSSSSTLVPPSHGSQNKKKKKRAAPADSLQVTPSPSQEGEDGPSPSFYDHRYPDEEDEEDNYPRWESCPNPWGDFGYVEGDVVLFAPSSTTVGGNNIVGVPTYPDGIMPKRFALDPMSATSPYRKTHACGDDGVEQRGDRGGYSVLLLKRDRLALRPWGFSTQVHEFGGACLVLMVSPCSPAEAAVDVGGFGCLPCPTTVARDDVCVSAESEPPAGSPQSSGLRVNDMILCVNGKIVGGMSEVELAVELEISGPEIVLVVSRCLDRKRGNGALLEASERERKSWYSTSFAGRNGLDWNDIGMDNEEDDEHRGCLQSHASAVKKRKTDVLRTPLEVEHSSRKDIPRDDGRIPSRKTMDTGKSTKRVSFIVQDNISTGTKSVIKSKTDQSIIRTGEDDDRDEAGKETRSCSTVMDEYGSGDIVERGSNDEGFDIDSDDDSINDRKSRCQDDESIDELGPLHQPEEEDEVQAFEHPSGEGSSTPDASVFDGDEPWLGCVCGKTHPEPIVVFWIQCDICRAWYNVAKKCVGFSEDEANDMESWECPPCRPSVSKPAAAATEGDDESTNSIVRDRHEQQQQEHPRSPQAAPLEPSDSDDESISKPAVIFPVSTIVDVAERTWPGSNKLGGVGRVTNVIVDSSSGSVAYDVAFVLGGREKGVPSKHVSLHDDIYSSSQSTLGTRTSRR